MNWQEYDLQESQEPHFAIYEVKKDGDGRQEWGREAGVQSYLRRAKQLAYSPWSDRAALLDFVRASPAPDAEHCRSRLGAGISPLLRWHYHTALFFAERGDWLCRAVPLVLDSARRTGDEFSASAYLLIAHNLNRWYNCRLDGRVLETALEFTRGCRAARTVRRAAEVVAVLETSSAVRDGLRDHLVGKALRLEPEKARPYLAAAIAVARDKAPAKAAWAGTYERHADMQEDPLLKLSYYECAKRHLDDPERLRGVNKKAAAAQKSVRLEGHAHMYNVRPCPVRGQCGFERVGSLVRTFMRLVHTAEVVRLQAAEPCGPSPLEHAFTRISLGDDGVPRPLGGGAGQGEAGGHARQLAHAIRLSGPALSAGARPHEDGGRITAESYVGYIESFGLCAPANLQLIREGAEAHCAGSYAAAVHILLPQLEHALRSLLEAGGAGTARGREAKLDLLKPMIERGGGAIGRGLAEFLRVWLVDDGAGSINLRNRVCHGMYADYGSMDGYDPLHELGHGTSLMLVLAICTLAVRSVHGGGSVA